MNDDEWENLQNTKNKSISYVEDVIGVHFCQYTP